MRRITLFTLCICILMMQYRLCQGHGHLLDPPSRSSMWREGFNTPRNYNDNQLNCGGYYNQWGLNRGKCGICGDPYQKQQPRDNESGGKYGTGVVSRSYTAGQVVTVKVLITANHMGWFEFKMCPDGSPTTPVTQECLDKYPLSLADGSGLRFDLGSKSSVVSVDVKLPDGVECKQCVIQWRWHAGNNYGVDASGNKCIGCGPQEEFYGCADVAISRSGSNNNPTLTNSPVTQSPLTNAPFTFKPYTDTPRTTSPNINNWTFMPITFPFFTLAPPTAPPQTLMPNQPVATFPTNQPIATSDPNQRPSGFIPISPAPDKNNNFIPGNPVNPYPTNLPPVTFRPAVTPQPQTTPRARVTFFRPPTTRSVTFRPVVTSQPQITTRAPITFFRPPTTRSPQTARPTNPPVTFFRPQTTRQPVILTLRPNNPPVTFFRPSATIPPQRATTPRVQVTTRPLPSTTKPSPSTTMRPIIFNLGGNTNMPATQQPVTSRSPLMPVRTSSRPPTTPRPNQGSGRFCYGINSWAGDPQLDQWCNVKCNLRGGTCPPEFCECV